MNPKSKMLFALATLGVCVSSNSFVVFGIVFFVVFVLLAVFAKIPVLYYCKLLLVPCGFLILSLLGIVVNVSVDYPDVPFFRVGYLFLFVTEKGIGQALFLASKSLTAIACLYFLILTTPLRDMIRVMYQLKVPAVLVEQFTLVYRFIFLLLEKTIVKKNSQTCRFGYVTWRNGLKSFGMLLASVFVQAFGDAEHIYDAMLTKGYDGTMKFLLDENKMKKRELGLIFGFEVVLILLQIV